MSIIEKYLTRECLINFCILLAIISGVFIVFDIVDEFDNLSESGLGFFKIVFVFLAHIPFISFIPVSLFMSVLFTLGIMSRNNEITALKSSGVSVYYLLRSIFFIGIFFSLFYFIVAEQVMPMIKSKESDIWLESKKKQGIVKSEKHNTWIKNGNIISRISHFDSKKNEAFNVALYYFDKEFHLIRRIDAKKGVYENGKWELHEVIEQIFDKATGSPEVNIQKEMVSDFKLTPKDLNTTEKKSEELSFIELRDYIEKVEAEGYDATLYKVNLYAKTAQPFFCIIMCIVGTGVALNRKLRDSLPLIILFGFGITFIYYVFYNFCLSIGYAGIIPPILSAWVPNFVFLCTGGVAVIYAE